MNGPEPGTCDLWVLELGVSELRGKDKGLEMMSPCRKSKA